MSGLNNERANKKYVSVLADGLLHMTVYEGTEGAKVREYETSDGVKGEKHELTFDTLRGIVTELFFFEGKFGNTLHLVFNDEIELSVNVASNYAEDIMKKLPNIDLSQEVVLKPYSFEDKNTKKTKKGFTISQNDQKINTFFYNPETKENINGYPKPEGTPAQIKKYKTDDWKMYFMQARKFLVEYTEAHFVTKKSETEEVEETDSTEL
jgi:hypothetical protein